jgi:hypothetical protein
LGLSQVERNRVRPDRWDDGWQSNEPKTITIEDREGTILYDANDNEIHLKRKIGFRVEDKKNGR